MAASYTAPAFVVHGHWSEETRKNPAVHFIERLVEEFFDTGNHANVADWYTENVSIRTPHAQKLNENDHGAFKYAAPKFYTEPLVSFKHFMDTIVAIESKTGWDLYVQCHIYGNAAGTPATGEEKVKDPTGKEWDIATPTFYYLDVMRLPDSPHGWKLNHVTLINDHGNLNDILGQRGVPRRRASK